MTNPNLKFMTERNNHGPCINPDCKCRWVWQFDKAMFSKGLRSSLMCHSCDLELPTEVWLKIKSEKASLTREELFSLERYYRSGVKGTLIQSKHGKALLERVGERQRDKVRRVRAVRGYLGADRIAVKKGRVRIMAKKKAKKTKVTKKTKVVKRTKITYPGRKGPQDDPRLPKVGKVIKTTYKGREIKVKRTSEGFIYKEKTYKSLSKIATKIAKCSQNGFRFFGLNGSKKAAPKATKKTKTVKKAKKAERVNVKQDGQILDPATETTRGRVASGLRR